MFRQETQRDIRDWCKPSKQDPVSTWYPPNIPQSGKKETLNQSKLAKNWSKKMFGMSKDSACV